MDKWEVARTLDEIANYVELSEPNRFKALVNGGQKIGNFLRLP